MPVEFTVRTSDLGQAISELQANRSEENNDDPVDIVVMESSAILSAIGTEKEIPATSKLTGSARVPLHIMLKIAATAHTYTQSEVVKCDQGSIMIGRTLINHAQIELRDATPHRLDVPVDLSVLDTLALFQVLDPGTILAEGLQPRVTRALATRYSAVNTAAAALEPLGVTVEQLKRLVDTHVLAAAKRLRPTCEAAAS
jgi:hypothetical protein